MSEGRRCATIRHSIPKYAHTQSHIAQYSDNAFSSSRWRPRKFATQKPRSSQQLETVCKKYDFKINVRPIDRRRWACTRSNALTVLCIYNNTQRSLFNLKSKFDRRIETVLFYLSNSYRRIIVVKIDKKKRVWKKARTHRTDSHTQPIQIISGCVHLFNCTRV